MMKFGKIIIAMVPMIGAFALQCIFTMGFMLYDGMKGLDLTSVSSDAEYMSQLSLKTMVCFVISGILIYSLWYLVGARITRYEQQRPLFTLKTLISCLLWGISIQFFLISVLTVLNEYLPTVMGMYSERMENSSIGKWNLLSILCTVILAPILEELIFRGMTIHFLKKAGFNFFVVNIIQAIIFGIYHLDLVQGIYAGMIGLVLGYIFYKYNSLWIGILVHMLINLTGTLANHFQDMMPTTITQYYVMGGVSLGIMVIAFILMLEDKPRIDTKGYLYE